MSDNQLTYFVIIALPDSPAAKSTERAYNALTGALNPGILLSEAGSRESLQETLARIASICHCSQELKELL